MNRFTLGMLAVIVSLGGCAPEDSSEPALGSGGQPGAGDASASQMLEAYAPFALTADLSGLSQNQRNMLKLLIRASEIMDELFWLQAYGDRDAGEHPPMDAATRRYFEINYGPWDRLNGDTPFVAGVGPKPLGANFYPSDMTVEEFEAAPIAGKTGLYSLVRRDEKGKLMLVPYHEAYREQLEHAASLLRQAAELADDAQFANYLRLRAQALVTDEYQPSDMAWMGMKNNRIDLVIGAIETYEDQLFGYRAGYEAFVLLKDPEWSQRLARYAQFLPELQKALPVPAEYKSESPGTDSDLNAYDAIYYAGHSNAGSKTIAINLPNDEEVQLKKGTRRLQLKNAMQAKFDKILVRIADELITPDQRKHVTFNAFFANTMFHEVAHGLGIKNTINGSGTVREALKDIASSMEEGKADVLGLYMITKLYDQGEIPEGELMDYYVTFLASIFRSVRFGASSAHGRANMVRFNYFSDKAAFERDAVTGVYRVDMRAMRKAIDGLSSDILRLQGDGDYESARRLTEDLGVVRPALQDDLARLKAAGIPVDIVFDQGLNILHL